MANVEFTVDDILSILYYDRLPVAATVIKPDSRVIVGLSRTEPPLVAVCELTRLAEHIVLFKFTAPNALDVFQSRPATLVQYLEEQLPNTRSRQAGIQFSHCRDDNTVIILARTDNASPIVANDLLHEVDFDMSDQIDLKDDEFVDIFEHRFPTSTSISDPRDVLTSEIVVMIELLNRIYHSRGDENARQTAQMLQQDHDEALRELDKRVRKRKIEKSHAETH